MADALTPRRNETASHARLKRLACIWAQARGYSACAVEVSLPHCRFRADVAAFRQDRKGHRSAIFECKQALPDLRRDNCESASARAQLEQLQTRRAVIERNLRVHYPTLRTGESLFPDFDAWDFSTLDHRGYSRVLRNGAAVARRLVDCTKFEKVARYHCANLFYLVIAEPLRDLSFEMPSGWGLLVQNGEALELVEKPTWHENTAEALLHFVRRVAAAATRAVNRELAITRDEIESIRADLI
ncbi:MAG: hypothetical protein DLM52_00360 [Chthoniobacterales bacterium]|nr:MAG: hypothetical protein DLM52_00360 [Chthoniobacterales bacterium]